MNGATKLNEILVIAIAVLFILIMVLAYVYWLMNKKEKQKDENQEELEVKPKEKKQKQNSYTKLSIFDFMEFDRIDDNMIVQDDGKKYLMVVECDGINYDLMSNLEKTAVEAGFISFLNTLNYPIQIYTQTRTINIESSIERYEARLKTIKKDLERKQEKYRTLNETGKATEKELQNLRIEIARVQNMYDYTYDVITNTKSTSRNKSVLKKSYYIIVPCFLSELDAEATIADEQEKQNIMFSELYTRAQSVVRSLYACNMTCRILDSRGLMELLYVAYNRDDSDIFGIDKAMNAGYEELYSTAPDVLDKRMKALDDEISKRAFDLANNTIETIRSEKKSILKKKEKSFEELIEEMAEALLKENEKYIGKEVTNEAIKRIKTKEEGGKNNETQTKKRTRKSTKSE